MTQPLVRDALYRRRRYPREVIETCVVPDVPTQLPGPGRSDGGAGCTRSPHLGDAVGHPVCSGVCAALESKGQASQFVVAGRWTFIRTRPKQTYLYRAVDKYGKTVESLLRPDRGIAAAQAFFRKALAHNLPKWPRKISLDGHVPSHVGLRLLRREDPKWKFVLVRTSQYLNNIVEQDHRAIKRRCHSAAMSFNARVQILSDCCGHPLGN